MTKIDIFSGFLGAGKTTLIRKLIREAYKGEKLVLIENEFGEIAIDGGFLKDAGVEITEMNSGCICCTLVGDFTKALKKVMEDFSPDRIIIEHSGVGKLSDVAAAVKGVDGAELGCKLTVVDAGKCRMYMRNFGEFFNDQVENADIIVMSRTDTAAESKILAAAELLKGLNAEASLITTPWDKLDGMLIKEAMDGKALKKDMEELEHEQHCRHHEHHGDEKCRHHHEHHEGDCCPHEHHHEHGEHCSCGHEHHEHHHEHGEHCSCGHDHHEHHHEHDEHCSCGHDHHEHHHEHGEHCSCGHEHHHADEVFASWGVETPKKFDMAKIEAALDKLSDQESFGAVLRAKGFVDSVDGQWIYFDYVPGEANVRRGGAAVTGRLCVIGSALNEQALKELFELD
ncbi:MAG: cobalamin biosynthesis protein CobW [Oscillospiraceae bacterium]|nr:cobalamin biosynthesis protein CobW [Oscillospiraceae bacterium]